jgi:hypothetical protein
VSGFFFILNFFFKKTTTQGQINKRTTNLYRSVPSVATEQWFRGAIGGPSRQIGGPERRQRSAGVVVIGCLVKRNLAGLGAHRGRQPAENKADPARDRRVARWGTTCARFRAKNCAEPVKRVRGKVGLFFFFFFFFFFTKIFLNENKNWLPV